VLSSRRELERAHDQGRLALACLFGMFFDELPPVIIEIPTTGERFVGRLSEEPFGPLCLAGPSNRPCYVLSRVLSIGWRVVECTPDERELMGTHGITPDGQMRR
jgi:hypothetical protein